MATKAVNFEFVTGLRRQIFRHARLCGSWDASGHYADHWTETPMKAGIGDDGCPNFTATVQFDLADGTKMFKWGVILDGP